MAWVVSVGRLLSSLSRRTAVPALAVFGTFHSEGRDACLRMLKSRAVKAELENEEKRLHIEEKQLEIKIRRGRGILKMARQVEKLKGEEAREVGREVQRALFDQSMLGGVSGIRVVGARTGRALQRRDHPRCEAGTGSARAGLTVTTG
jgi:hypothetical protein